MTQMNINYDKYDDSLYPLTDMFEGVNETNYLQYSQIANVQYNFLLHNKHSSGYHFVNWRVNFSNLHEYIILNQKSNESIISFLKIYENSVPLLYKMLGLKY
mgnify:CR=1 FL=1|jgi:hypothetical protein